MVRPILLYPNPILKEVCDEVDWRDPSTQELCQDLIDTMQASPGVGLAAPQLGVRARAMVVDVTPKHPGYGLLLLLNPRIEETSQTRVTGREGCLSIPEYTANVTRFERVTVSGVSPHGQQVRVESVGLESICLQHEIDHLEGILFLDRVSSLKTDMFRRKGVASRSGFLEAVLAKLQA